MSRKLESLCVRQAAPPARLLERQCRWAPVMALFFFLAAGQPALADPPTKKLDFGRDIRPILSDRCFACHGPDAGHRKGKLRLDVRAGAFREKDPVIVPGQPDQSEIIARLVSTDPSERMPPDETKKPLTPDQIEAIRTWVRDGAEWKEHWAFVPPTRPALPEVAKKDWPRNEVDRFILARLEREGLQPSPGADPVTLLRRLSLDLTGLPPTIDELEAFLKDPGDAAVSRTIEQLFSSPHHGEHMARYWLDAARYGDTHGLHLDNLRGISPYRDWVINAFNQNLPYDRFLLEQVAGDLLPGSTLPQRIATGFLRCHVSTSEGGVIEEEVYVRNVTDTVSTTMMVFQGVTAGCATCHDHKFDPLTTKDYYQLFAFFNSIDGSALDGNAVAWPPVERVPTQAQAAETARLRQVIEDTNKEIAARIAAQEVVEPAVPAAFVPPPPREETWLDDDLPRGATVGAWKRVEQPVRSGKVAFVQEDAALVQNVVQGLEQPFTVPEGAVLFAHVYLDPANPPAEVMLQWNDGSWEHRAYWGEDLIGWGTTGQPSRRGRGALPQKGEWVRLEVPAAEVGLKPGTKVLGLAFTQHGGKCFWDLAGAVTRAPLPRTFDSMKTWLTAIRTIPGAAASLPQALAPAAAKEETALTAEERLALRNYFVEQVLEGARATFEPLHTRRADAQKRLDEIEKAIPTTLVFKERATPREAFILKRGQYDQHGDQVTRETPGFLPSFPADFPRNRLGLARWLLLPEQPLTARVAVNRLWQQVFGTGLVKTAEDFGSQGDPPSHPELLDWLATELVRSGWDQRHILRLIVSSATYRQSSASTPELLARDRENRLLARSPRYRLDAEVIRDLALFASGLLVDEVGGASVKPPQPSGLWEAVGYTSSNTAQFSPDVGQKVHRRSLYTFWKRTSPPPQMTTLDAPSRESCTVRRERTNTPLQALLLLNEEQFVEAARSLATRVMRGGTDPAKRLRDLFRLTLARAPVDSEVHELLALLGEIREDFRKDPAGATSLIGIGESRPDSSLEPLELAAWTLAASTVLNLDEVVSRN